ncbi:hypothetical protein ABFY43_20785 [Bacillus pumilus]
MDDNSCNSVYYCAKFRGINERKRAIKGSGGTPTAEALHLLDKLTDQNGKKDTGVIIFSEQHLFPKKEQELKKALSALMTHAPDLHIDGITSYFSCRSGHSKTTFIKG